MREIIFNQTKREDFVVYRLKPVTYISKIHFITNDKNWVNRLISVQLILKCDALNENDKVLLNSEVLISIGAMISPNHISPVFEPRIYKYFDKMPSLTVPDPVAKWRFTLRLSKMNFVENEEIRVQIMEKEYINKRVENWIERVDHLYTLINSWSVEIDNCTTSFGENFTMNEKLMMDFKISPKQIKTLKVFVNSNLKFVFRPKGLWVIGANGRIDVLSATEPKILVDLANNFQEPNWKIYSQNRRENIAFTKDTFNSLLNL